MEFLADSPDGDKRVSPLPSRGNVSALNIPHSSIVLDMHGAVDVTAELIGGGFATEAILHADLVAHTCLKAFAFEHRRENEDAHDLIYCLENIDGGFDALAPPNFEAALAGKHGDTVREALDILHRRFRSADGIEGYRRDGPTAVALFEIEEDSHDAREARTLRQRQVSSVIDALFSRLPGFA